MSKTYLREKAIKKSFMLKGGALLLVLAVIFFVFLVRFAMSGSRFDYLQGAPKGDDAYSIAKQFIKPTIKLPNISFPDSGYQCAQKPDSVFIVKSYAEAKNITGAKSVISFEITMRYNGGPTTNKSSWEVIKINED